MPSDAFPRMGVGPHLWILRRPASPEDSGGHVLLADLSRASDSTDLGGLVSLWRRYSADPASFDAETGVAVSIQSVALLDDLVDLSPRRHLPRSGTVLETDALNSLRKQFVGTLETLWDDLPEPAASQRMPWGSTSMTTIDRLARVGAPCEGSWAGQPGWSSPCCCHWSRCGRRKRTQRPRQRG
jgi:hypothetical protein